MNFYQNINLIIYNGIYLNQKKLSNEDGFENKLIEVDISSRELVNNIKDCYLNRDYISGEIGTTDGEYQYDGIFNITLYMLMSNRLAKYYRHEAKKNSNLDKETINLYNEKYKELITSKDDALNKLIYSLFIYKETINNNDFYYGHRLDSNGNHAFCIDLPGYGQISVHFGSERTFEHRIFVASKNIKPILEKKLKLGQITKKQHDELRHKVNIGKILPEYTGKLYEQVSALPTNYRGKQYRMAQRRLNLSRKLVTDINDDDIKRISENEEFNSRELYYFAVKSDFSKKHLEQLSIALQERDKKRLEELLKPKKKKNIDVQELGKKSVGLTTAQDRKQVSEHVAHSTVLEGKNDNSIHR